MQQSNTSGKIEFKLTSPQAIINANTRNVKAGSTNVIFYNEEDIPIYQVESNESYISNNSTEILLVGDVILTRQGKNTITMKSNSVKWDSVIKTI